MPTALFSQDTIKQKRQQERVNEISVQLEQLSTHYRTQKSYFSRAAAWYSTSPWWMRWGLGPVTLITGALIGLLFSPFIITAPLWSGLATLTLYLSAAAVLIQHHRSDEKRTQALLSEINNMEEILQEAIASLHQLEIPMTDVLNSLTLKNTAKAADIRTFQESVQTLDTQVSQTDHSIQIMQGNQALFNKNNQVIERLMLETSATQTELSQNQHALTQVTQDLTETHALLQENVQALDQISADIAQNTSTLRVFDGQFRQLTNTIQDNQAKFEIHTHQPVHVAPLETVEERAQSSTDLQEQALRKLNRFLALENAPSIEETTRHRFHQLSASDLETKTNTHTYPYHGAAPQ